MDDEENGREEVVGPVLVEEEEEVEEVPAIVGVVPDTDVVGIAPSRVNIWTCIRHFISSIGVLHHQHQHKPA